MNRGDHIMLAESSNETLCNFIFRRSGTVYIYEELRGAPREQGRSAPQHRTLPQAACHRNRRDTAANDCAFIG